MCLEEESISIVVKNFHKDGGQTSINDWKSPLASGRSKKSGIWIMKIAYFDGAHTGYISVVIRTLHDLILPNSRCFRIFISFLIAEKFTAAPPMSASQRSCSTGSEEVGDVRAGHGGEIRRGIGDIVVYITF